ncbi:magnesium transporter [Azorhizobium oxalatiphilum]|uniref:Protein MgtC n=1 Tax=Azorhizobium oxalatiphilum TaxID=980631 RepID=A0A917FKQ2_9HYPH|nr:MgtC/SapB family protein [Azorhizobium oxalatiphilum]GGF89581.1 magnesium transporter [Azorhizobium oxalatiphilum]
MPLHADFADIALRLACAFGASLIIGLDRELEERAAGLRTTILVCLAACLAMISSNLLLAEVGRADDSFAQMDVLRLPLGILTGMGFIGAGAIMRREDGLVLGVTTAATLWYMTVLGLIFGAGQYVLGGLALLVALGTLWLLKFASRFIRQEREAVLRVVLASDGTDALESALWQDLNRPPFRIRRSCVARDSETGARELRFELRYAGEIGRRQPDEVARLMGQAGVVRVEWEN